MPVHVSNSKCSSSGGPNCINTSSGITHSGNKIVWWVTVWRAGQEDRHVRHSPTRLSYFQCVLYQMMYWYNLALLMMSTCCSKHVQAWNKYNKKECVKLVINQNAGSVVVCIEGSGHVHLQCSCQYNSIKIVDSKGQIHFWWKLWQ
jgi:hypothetical protein